MERIYTNTLCHHNWAYYTEKRESICPLPSVSLSDFSSTYLSCFHGCICSSWMWQQKPMGTSFSLCVCSSLIILMGIRDISMFAHPTFPQVLCFRIGGRSWGPSRECPGPWCSWWSWATCLGVGPGLWYLEVCDSQVLCPWSGVVPGSYFGRKWTTSPS